MALLRASGQHAERDYRLAGVLDAATSTGVPGGGALIAWADATLAAAWPGSDPTQLTAARDAVHTTLGSAAVIDGAAVIGGFDGITRIADAIGIPLEPAKAEQTADFFAALELGRFRAAKA